MKDIAEEAREEVKEASKAGARGKEYRDPERMGDEGQAYRRGGATPKHHSIHRERGGYMPEEVEASERDRGQRKNKELPHEDEPKGAHEGEADEKYPNEGERKHGGRVKHKRAKGGMLPLDGAKEHKVHLPHHKARKRGGAVHGEHEKHRPDKRARGGGVTADLRPETAAGRVSLPSYLRQHDVPQTKAHGVDSTGPRALTGGKRPGPNRD